MADTVDLRTAASAINVATNPRSRYGTWTTGLRYAPDIATYTVWAATTAVGAGVYRTSAGNLYYTSAGGTTGSTAPTHFSGTVTDGAVLWEFVGTSPVLYGNNLYRPTVAGVAGATPPTHTTGTASDGGVTWQFVTTFPAVKYAKLSTYVGSSSYNMDANASELNTPAENVTAWNNAFAAMKSTGGTIKFGRRYCLDTPITNTGFVSIEGEGYTVIHRFSQPEPATGAIFEYVGSGIANNTYGFVGAGYDQPDGLIVNFLDTNILGSISVRPRAHMRYHNFGVLFNRTVTQGSAFRNVGTMYVEWRKLSIAFAKTWGIYCAGREDLSPGSANGCKIGDVIVTSSGPNSTAGGGIYWGSPDSYIEPCQVSPLGIGWLVLGGNVSGNLGNIWNHTYDGLRLQSLTNADLRAMIYDGSRTHIRVMAGCTGINLTGTSARPNSSSQVTATDGSNVYIESTADKVKIDMLLDGNSAALYGV